MDPPSEVDENQVTEFLQRIRELDDRRDREDEERTRKLEEDILARREARQKLRAERARSLSPEKMTPIGTPLSYRSRATESSSPMTVAQQDSPLASRSKPVSTPGQSVAEARNDTLEKLMSEPRPLPTPPSKPLTTASHTFTPSPSSVTGSTRRPFNQAGKPLSWQRRPQSVAFGERERPTFTQSTFSRTSSVAGDDNESDAGSEISRDQIAKNLGSKDPSYFRQTADRGFKSAALRKDAEDSYSGGGARMALPGMSDRANELPRPLSSLSNASGTTSFSAPLTEFKSISKAKSFLDSLPDERPLSAGESMQWKPMTYSSKAHQQIEASFVGLGPHEEEENSLMPSAYIVSNSGRNSPDKLGRSSSPTKGLGGFVQSAMLKRDASVRKGPSGNTMSTLSRSGSNVSDKEWTTPTRRERALSNLSRDGTPAPEEREVEERRGREMSPAESVVSNMTTSTDGWRARTEATPPTSPSKTMNPRRWSPTKSSWLESALQKDIAPVIGAQPPQMFPPARDNPQRSPTREKSIKTARDSAAIREERVRARMAASAVPRKMSVDSQTDHPRFDASSFSRPGVHPKSAMLSKRPLSEIFNPPPSFDFSAPFGKATVEEEQVEEVSKPEAPSSIPRPAIPSKPSIPEKPTNGTESKDKDKPPVKSKPVFERGPGRTMTIDPRAAREASLREQQQAKKDGVLDFRSRLSPTKTQNYRAPDELKETILAGKSALQDRGGPMNYKPPNELKEKVLAAKASLQDRGGPQNYKPPNELKEVVAAARGNLQASSGPQKYQAPDPLKETVSVARSHLRPSSPVKNSPDISPTKPSFGRTATAPVNLEGKTNVPSYQPESGDAIFEKKEKPAPAVSKQTTAPARMEKSGGKLADRFNPGLAGLISRGPMGMGKPGVAGGFSSSSNTSKSASKEPAEGPQLTHMTKSRARGPRRRAPAGAPSPTTAESEKQRSHLSPNPRSTNPTRRSLGQNGLGSRPLSPAPVTPRKPSAVSIQYDDQEESQLSAERREKPPTPAKSPLLRAKSSTLNMRDSPSGNNSNPPTPNAKPRSSLNSKGTDEEIPAVKPLFFTPQERGTPRRLPTPPSASVSPSPGASRPLPQVPAKSKPSTDPEEAETIVAPSVKDSISRWGSTNSTPDTTPQRKGMIKLPTYQDEVAAMESSKAYRSPQASGAGGPTPSPLRLGSSRAIDESILNVVGIDAAKYLSQFFTGPVTMPPKGGIDVTSLIESKPKQSAESVQTLKKQMWEITGINGKKDHVPVGQEHILYEDGLYMCLHSYMENNGMMASEVFLWSGDRVSLGTVEEAQLSARRLAREYDGRLIVIQQGKEVSRFIEALGGVIITRRGSRARIQQDIPYMLCCRKVSGGIAFDEVDIHFTNLCSGFPYIISTPDRLYLWKGKGASLDELRAARVASFDLAGDNEVKQIDEDKEPEFFVEMMGGELEGQSINAQYWSLKPQHMQYTTRVFLIDHESPNSAIEIYPFAQSDLDPSNIYIVDAFFELYIIVGEQAQDKRIDFQHALLFTQEYSIMAASNEDRPFVPPSNVVLGGAPKELKVVFRRWEDSKTPTAWHPTRNPSVKLTMGLRDAMSMMDF
ncbi:hypothetical protein TWF730_010608 [Orbilia blumenaviensis]|uniref:DUF4045 domain-containing protein n=1 Tax=Orbilia blumenaviensis TaxID=1796055 RepID=A0AAV9UT64_9PEZI